MSGVPFDGVQVGSLRATLAPASRQVDHGGQITQQRHRFRVGSVDPAEAGFDRADHAAHDSTRGQGDDERGFVGCQPCQVFRCRRDGGQVGKATSGVVVPVTIPSPCTRRVRG